MENFDRDDIAAIVHETLAEQAASRRHVPTSQAIAGATTGVLIALLIAWLAGAKDMVTRTELESYVGRHAVTRDQVPALVRESIGERLDEFGRQLTTIAAGVAAIREDNARTRAQVDQLLQERPNASKP